MPRLISRTNQGELFQMLGTSRGSEYKANRVDKSSFVLNREIDSLISHTESLVINKLEGGDRQTAMKRLKVTPTSLNLHFL